MGCLKSWFLERWASQLGFTGSPSVDALAFPPWDGLTSGTPQTAKCGNSKVPSCEAAYLAAGCPRALETWTVEEPDGWPGRKLSRFLMFGALCKFHGNLGKIDSPCWDFAELVNSSEMLFCLKPSEQVQYLQLSFEDGDNMFPCTLLRGSSGSQRSTHLCYWALCQYSHSWSSVEEGGYRNLAVMSEGCWQVILILRKSLCSPHYTTPHPPTLSCPIDYKFSVLN